MCRASPFAARHLASAATLAVAAVLLLPTLTYGFGFDHGFMEYIAWAALKGRWPYADSWDESFPGAILVHLGVIAAGGTSVLALRAVDWVVQIVNAALLLALGRRLAGVRAGFYAAAAYAIAYTAGTYYHTAQRDSFLVPLMLAALWALWRFLDEPSRRAPLAGAAASAGLACLIRPTYALLVALTAVALVLRPAANAADPGTPRGARLIDGPLFAAVAALPLLLFVGVYAAAGHLRSLIELATLLSTVYVHLERRSTGEVLFRLFTAAPVTMWIGVALTMAGRTWREARREFGTVVALFAGCVLVRVWESKGYLYQYWPAIGCLALIAGAGWAWAANALIRFAGLAGRRALIGAAAVVAAVLLCQLGRTGLGRYRSLAPALLRPQDEADRFRHMLADSQSQAELARYLRAHTTAQDRIQLWGPESMVLYAARRLSATRFLDPFAFLCPAQGHLALFSDCGPSWHKPIQVAFRHELISGLRQRPPRYIAAHYAQGSLAIAAGYCVAPDLPELRELLDTRYQRVATFGNWSAFRRRDAP